ncbi:hypothetical protein M885DRAFT_175032 [Pelagophyceae sp. CCMP2097]|nr:hypothetical protein M885DRAFT_175032 [Pelagophyceae sp. CCMP2097]|mmetsp:Transcript_1216/g.4285  ORF Transcript_1216/g.4285 Transcript_1216/m.4285 type:complete len:87 (-) Transcript_1216:124-384(-)
MSAIFDFSSLITVSLLFICTCTYVRAMRSSIFDEAASANAPPEYSNQRRRSGLRGFCWKAARVGERVSPYVSASLVLMAINLLFFK